jgi:hypothetical protein
VSLVEVDGSPQQLRQHAEHCRNLADSQISERTRVILKTMAKEFDQQARDIDATEQPENGRGLGPLPTGGRSR